MTERTLGEMQQNIKTWSKCLARAAKDNETLANLIAESGYGCFPAPGSWTTGQFAWTIVGGIVAGFVVLGLLMTLCIIYAGSRSIMSRY